LIIEYKDYKHHGLDHHLDHRVGWVERSETQHFVFVGFRSSTQPTFHALAKIMIKANIIYKKEKEWFIGHVQKYPDY
jgi:hypothetical protein